MAKVQINTHITPETYAALEGYCAANKVSKAATIEAALRRFLAEWSNLAGEIPANGINMGVNGIDKVGR